MVLFAGISSSAFCQVEGLWVVTKVMVGEKDMTPSAKWFNLKANGKFSSGNGWQQHTVGSWHSQGDQLFLTNENWINPNADPVMVSKQDDTHMVWQSQEEEGEVHVFLERASELPASHIDKVIGLWDFDSAEKEGSNSTQAFDPEDNVYLLIRWDRKFNYNNHPGKLNFGDWFVHPHKNEIHFRTDENHKEVWAYEVSHDRLMLIADNGEILNFKRITEFTE